MNKWHMIAAATALLTILLVSDARATVLTKLDRIRPYDVEFAGFQLAGAQTVAITATGYRDGSSRHDLMMTNAWILDADSRAMVWSLRDAGTDRAGRHLREYEGEAKLPAGRYEVYFEAVPSWGRDTDDDDDEDDDFNWSRVFGGDKGKGWDMEDFEDVSDDFRIVVEGTGTAWARKDIEAHHESLIKDAIFARIGLRNDHYEKKSLKLERDMELNIYAVGEATKEGNYDTSWILNIDTREKVWMLDYRESERAGGAKKNRVFNGTIKLPKGNYALFVVTDDSHSARKWNGAPPYDPAFWGVTIRVADKTLAQYAKIGEYEDMTDENAVVTLAGLRDEAYESYGFTIKKRTKLRVYAIGEGYDSDMADYSWIVDAATREKVWEFTYRNSEHAGGGAKNRMIDEVIELDAGNYIAYAVTDDSHSYRHWNASAPHDQERWGLTITTVAAGDRKLVVQYEEGADETALVQMIRVRNNEDLRQSFTLDRDATVRVYALGEGQDGRMHDYAWIEKAGTGRVVWEMTYRSTDHAGGAKKNRMFNDTIQLEKGEYVVYYESDDSHSYNRWNARPPSDLHSWGVTVRLAEGK